MIRRLLHILLLGIMPFSLFSQQTTLIDSLQNLYNKATHDTIRVELLNDLSWEWNTVDYNKAKRFANKALQISLNNNFQRGIATSYNMLASVYDYSAKYDSAIYFYDKALEIRRKLKDKAGSANILNNIGGSYYFRSDFKNALFYYIQAEKIREEIGDVKGLSQSINNIGLIYRVMGDYENAVKSYKKSLQLKNALNDLQGIYMSSLNLSVAFQNLNQYDSSIKYCNIALLKANALGDSSYLASAHINLGKSYKDKKNSILALKHLEYAKKLLIKTDNNFDLIYCLSILGETYLSVDNYANAEDAFLKALYISKKNQRNELTQSLLYNLSNVYYKTGKIKKAYDLQNEYIQFKDSIFSIEKDKNLNELKIQYETELKEKEIKQLQKEKEITDLTIEKERRWKQFLYIILMLSLLVVIIAFIAFIDKSRTNKKINAQKTVIEKSLKEKEILLKEIHHRVKNNLQIINGLLELQESLHSSEETKNIVNEAQGRIKTMAIIHEMLYQTHDIEKIDFNLYVQRLVKNISTGYSGSGDKIKIKYLIDAIYFNIDTIIPLGLILNELVSNVYKYVFIPKNGSLLEISIHYNQEDWELTVKDDGKGLGVEISEIKESSFGLKLVKMLARQLKGKMIYTFDNGSVFRINFKEL
ncbi:MAG: tetratricopeptide repeat protein [Flavobacteriales bacterium]|nr:tetratricopeptide repeat protein [Flavobacteriales bacterium]